MNERDPQEMFCTLWGEVAVADCYGLRTINWEPTEIIDIGANVGTFTVWSAILFPDAPVLAYEPDAWNLFALRKFTQRLSNIRSVGAGLGDGRNLWREFTREVGGNQAFVSHKGRTDEQMDEAGATPTEVPSGRLGSFLAARETTGPFIVKIDCEGEEGLIFQYQPDYELLPTIDYLAIEFHYLEATEGALCILKNATLHILEGLRDTHFCSWNGDVFIAERKELRDGD
jgi:FkbM family methyltransferase